MKSNYNTWKKSDVFKIQGHDPMLIFDLVEL